MPATVSMSVVVKQYFCPFIPHLVVSFDYLKWKDLPYLFSFTICDNHMILLGFKYTVRNVVSKPLSVPHYMCERPKINENCIMTGEKEIYLYNNHYLTLRMKYNFFKIIGVEANLKCDNMVEEIWVQNQMGILCDYCDLFKIQYENLKTKLKSDICLTQVLEFVTANHLWNNLLHQIIAISKDCNTQFFNVFIGNKNPFIPVLPKFLYKAYATPLKFDLRKVKWSMDEMFKGYKLVEILTIIHFMLYQLAYSINEFTFYTEDSFRYLKFIKTWLKFTDLQKSRND